TGSCENVNWHCDGTRTRAFRQFQTIRQNNESLLFALAVRISMGSAESMSMPARESTPSITGTLRTRLISLGDCATSGLRSTGDFFEHLRVRREFFHEHQETLDRFLRFMTGEAAADKIDFL